MISSINAEQLNQLADKCDNLASLLRDGKTDLLTWRWIVERESREILNLFEEYNIVQLDD